MVSSTPAHLRSTCRPVLQDAGILLPLRAFHEQCFQLGLEPHYTEALRRGERRERKMWQMFPVQAHRHPSACAPSPHVSLTSPIIIWVSAVPNLPNDCDQKHHLCWRMTLGTQSPSPFRPLDFSSYLLQFISIIFLLHLWTKVKGSLSLRKYFPWTLLKTS